MSCKVIYSPRKNYKIKKKHRNNQKIYKNIICYAVLIEISFLQKCHFFRYLSQLAKLTKLSKLTH